MPAEWLICWSDLETDKVHHSPQPKEGWWSQTVDCVAMSIGSCPTLLDQPPAITNP